ncbi:MAG TPA: HNH endonuclease signature motif containing protein [Ktedonobacteraceae bacterium]|nr:HNH endonuclease signature motif containing protein [Ktedonobacteraceae bacterium]
METFSRNHDPLIRFQSRIIKDTNECWIWQGKIAANGRAIFKVNGRSVYVHKWAYEHYKGPTPEGLVLDHLCKIPACVNPDHLEAVTQLENNRRMRTHCRNGHFLTVENTYLAKNGNRICRTCLKKRSKKYQQRSYERQLHTREGLEQLGGIAITRVRIDLPHSLPLTQKERRFLECLKQMGIILDFSIEDSEV